MKKSIFFVLKHQSVTNVSVWFFQGLFKNAVFRSVALVTKKLWAILDFFFTDRNFFLPCILKNIFLRKKPLDYYSLKVTKFHGDSVKNESARTKKKQF